MSFKSASRLQAVTDELTHVRDQIRDLAAEQLPRIADAAQRTGESVARASSSAGRSAVRHLRAVPPALSETADSLRKSGTLDKSVRFMTSRPVLVAVGGVVIARVGLSIWRRMRPKAEEAKPASPKTKARTSRN